MKFLNIILSYSTGGESKIFREISEHYHTEKLVIFDREKSEISDVVISPVRILLTCLMRLNMDIGAFVSSVVSSLFLKRSYLRNFDIIFLNTSSMAVPRIKRLIAIIYTPPRALTDRYSDSLKLIEERGRIYVLLFRASKVFLNAIYRISVSSGRCLVCNSRNVKERLREYYEADCGILYHFVNAKDYRCTTFSPFFLYVSRINPGKRQHLTIDAFKLFYDGKRSFKLIIAGTVDGTEHSKRYFEELKRRSQGYPVEFVLSASDEEVREMYANCYLTLFTAQNEDFGLAPLESMASGKPVIALNEGGPKETILNGVTGFLVDDVERLAERMLYLVDHPEENMKMGRKGMEHVEKNFSPESFFARIDMIIESSLRNGSV